LALSAWPNNWY